MAADSQHSCRSARVSPEVSVGSCKLNKVVISPISAVLREVCSFFYHPKTPALGFQPLQNALQPNSALTYVGKIHQVPCGEVKSMKVFSFLSLPEGHHPLIS